MRPLFVTAALLGLTPAAGAHFVFVYVDGAEARLVFGHTAAPDPAAFPARAEKTALIARDTDGKETKLAAEKGHGNFFRAKLPGRPVVVFGTTEAGVTQRGDAPPLLSVYYPKLIVGDPFAAGTAAGTPLELVPFKDGDRVRFQTLAAGKPVAGVEVTVGVPAAAEEEAEV